MSLLTTFNEVVRPLVSASLRTFTRILPEWPSPNLSPQLLVGPHASNWKLTQCDVSWYPQDQRPCLDPTNIRIEYGSVNHAKMVTAFLYNHFWPREPSVVSMWMSMDSPYIKTVTDKYAHFGDKWLAFEKEPRTDEDKLIGVAVANKIFPWQIKELEDWAHCLCTRPEQDRISFSIHCLKEPDLFTKFKVPYIYEIELVATVQEVTGCGVGTMLLKKAIADATELRHPLIMVIAVSTYMAKICAKCGLQKAWSMDYWDFVDERGLNVFYPRSPHYEVSIWVKKFDHNEIYKPTECLKKLGKR